jgi:DNA-binding transcriptional ArsR family regulator
MSERDVDGVFDLVGNELARRILVLTSETALSAEELTERCDASRPTIYRRLDALETRDLVTEEVRYDADGNHCSVYECRLEELRFGISDGEFTVDVELRSPGDRDDPESGGGEGDADPVPRSDAADDAVRVGDADAR